MIFKILLLLIFLLQGFANSQDFKIAVFTNLQHNLSDKINLTEQLIKDLNEQENISKLFVVGNLTKTGDAKEFSSLSETLQNTTIPFYVVGGINDYNKNFFGKDLMNQTFTCNEFAELQNNFLFAGVNSIIASKSASGFVTIETLQNLREKIKPLFYEYAFFFSNFGLNGIQNKNEIQKILSNTSLLSISPSTKTNFASPKIETGLSEIQFPSSSISDNPNYFIMEFRNDSVFIFNRKIKNKLTELKYSFSFSDIRSSQSNSDSSFIDPALLQTKEIDFQTSSTQPLAIGENKIFTLLDNGLIYRNDFNWNEKFVAEILGNVRNNFIYYKDLILCATFDGDLYSVNANNGEILQVVGIAENISSDLTLIDIDNQSVKSKAVVFGTSQGNIFCYDAFTFELIWKSNISHLPVVGKPEFEDDKIIFTNSSSSLFCVNTKSGVLNWKLEFGDGQNFYGKNFPISNGKIVFSFTSDNKLFAVDLLLGKILWTYENKEIIREVYFSNESQNLLLLNSNGVLVFISAKEGKEIKRLDFKKSNVFSFKFAEQSGKYFIGFSDGSLYTFDETKSIKNLISASDVPVTSIVFINGSEIIVKDINGKIKFYKMDLN